jgi:hypothetical protein
MRQILMTGAAALIFIGVFLLGDRVHPLRLLFRNPRSAVSLGAGLSTAYVFVHVMPELHDIRSAFVASTSMPLRYEGMAIYFVALLGFLMFYGLYHFAPQRAAVKGEAGPAFKIQIGGFAAYVGSIAYLLVNNIEDTPVSTLIYAAAISFHFLALDHSLREQHGAAYEQFGRFILAGSCALCWTLGLFLALPKSAIALSVAFISGGIVINSSIMELASAKDGKFLAFAAGGIVYGLILMPLG